MTTNISEVARGNGHYNVEGWRNHIVRSRANADWWIRSDLYDQLLADLRAVNFEVNTSRSEVSAIINRVPKDLPAAVSARFPGARGVLGSDTYKEIYFVRIKPELKQRFLNLIAAADQGKNRDIEVGRPTAPTVTNSAGGNQAIVAQRGVNAVRDTQPMRDGALHFRYELRDIELAVVDQFDQVIFEDVFKLTWTPAQPGP
uniref:Coat protein n=1 Tax=Indian peanut clump virus L TaxID=119102 RepID=Q9IZ93_9VIRU|nr:coat protein [Indian peanut clump virus L]